MNRANALPERRDLSLWLVPTLTLLLGLIIRLALAWRDIRVLDTHILIDDTYLSLGIARNIALGYGSSFDREVFTNGYQPLYVWLMVPVYMVFPNDKILPVHLALTLLAISDTVTGYLLYRIVQQGIGYWHAVYACAAWMLNPLVIQQSMNGLETGLVALSVAATAYWYLRHIQPYAEPTRRNILLFGLIGGLTVCNRIDQSFLMMALSVDLLLRYPTWRTIRQLSMVAAIALAICLPWFGLGIWGGSGPFPESGAAVRYQGHTMLQGDIWAYAEAFPVLLREIFRSPFLALPWVLMGIGLFLVRHRFAWAAAWYDLAARRLAPLRFAWFYIAAMLMAYWLIVPGYWYYYRYMFPTSFFVLIGIACLIPTPQQWHGWLRGGWHAIAIILVLLVGRGMPDLLWATPAPAGYRPIALWLEQNLPNTTIASYQIGAIGYWTETIQVVNLDGVVDHTALRYRRDGQVLEYARMRDADWIVDWTVPPGIPEDGDITRLPPVVSVPEIQTWGKSWYVFDPHQQPR